MDDYSRWDVVWGPPIDMRPWPRFKRKWTGRISDAWAVLRGKACIEIEEDEYLNPAIKRHSLPFSEWRELYFHEGKED